MDAGATLPTRSFENSREPAFSKDRAHRCTWARLFVPAGRKVMGTVEPQRTGQLADKRCSSPVETLRLDGLPT